ncbi:E3 ubiquitin-protein ligase BRE1-like 2 [Populus alba x Populus x berolinensis]|nr:E3 ubiquitin-protein ligase BRE1-like 2 [Populus alba x Populus x berolinensis]
MGMMKNVLEIKESESRAHSQAEVLKSSLDEHSLELRVKAAIEAEAACHQRLSATEAERAGLRAKLDASERDVFELKKPSKVKIRRLRYIFLKSRHVAHVLSIIGQAYEDMQTQNQHLLQQVGERDDHTISSWYLRVKTKQSKQSFLLSGKQAPAKHLQQVNASVESLKSRIAHSEEQMKHYVIEAVRSTKEDRHLAINLESALLELMDAEKELKWLKYAVSSSQKEYDQIQTRSRRR